MRAQDATTPLLNGRTSPLFTDPKPVSQNRHSESKVTSYHNTRAEEIYSGSIDFLNFTDPTPKLIAQMQQDYQEKLFGTLISHELTISHYNSIIKHTDNDEKQREYESKDAGNIERITRRWEDDQDKENHTLMVCIRDPRSNNHVNEVFIYTTVIIDGNTEVIETYASRNPNFEAITRYLQQQNTDKVNDQHNNWLENNLTAGIKNEMLQRYHKYLQREKRVYRKSAINQHILQWRKAHFNTAKMLLLCVHTQEKEAKETTSDWVLFAKTRDGEILQQSVRKISHLKKTSTLLRKYHDAQQLTGDDKDQVTAILKDELKIKLLRAYYEKIPFAIAHGYDMKGDERGVHGTSTIWGHNLYDYKLVSAKSQNPLNTIKTIVAELEDQEEGRAERYFILVQHQTTSQWFIRAVTAMEEEIIGSLRELKLRNTLTIFDRTQNMLPKYTNPLIEAIKKDVKLDLLLCLDRYVYIREVWEFNCQRLLTQSKPEKWKSWEGFKSPMTKQTAEDLVKEYKLKVPRSALRTQAGRRSKACSGSETCCGMTFIAAAVASLIYALKTHMQTPDWTFTGLIAAAFVFMLFYCCARKSAPPLLEDEVVPIDSKRVFDMLMQAFDPDDFEYDPVLDVVHRKHQSLSAHTVIEVLDENSSLVDYDQSNPCVVM